MRSHRLFTRSNPSSRPLLRTEKGFLTLASAAAICLALVVSYIGLRFGFPFLDGKTAGDIKTCITDVKAALQSLKDEKENSGDPQSKELGWDDARVQTIERCRALLAQVANDLKNNRTSGFTDKGHQLTNLIPDTLDGFTVSNKCSVEDPLVGTAGVEYRGVIRAHIPFGGANATGALNMSGAVGGQSGNFKDFGNFNWSGTLNIPAAASKQAGAKTSSVNVAASTTVFDRNGNPFVPTSGIPCPGGSTIQPGGACKVTCSASKSFTWKNPPVPKINLFLVGPSVLDLTGGRPPGFILFVWNVKDAVSVSIDQGIGTVDRKGHWFEFPPLQDTTYTLTATGVRPEDTQTKSQTVKIVRRCSETQTAGGDTADTRIINLGKTAGTFKFDYETYIQEDQMIVTYEGKVPALFNTGCVGTNGTKSTTLSYSGSSTQISVQVIPNCKGGSGTAWNYTVHCPL